MGLFGPSIEVATLPSTLPSLCFALSLTNPRSPVSVRVRMLAPSGQVVATAEAPRPPSYPAPPFVSSHQFRIFPFRIEQEGTYELRFAFDGDEDEAHELVHRIQVRVAPP